MVTTPRKADIASCLLGKTCRAVLALLYGHAGERFYLRQIVRISGSGLGPVQRELKKLTGAGIIQRTAEGRQVYFQANSECPVFAELKGLMLKTAGTADVLRTALAALGERIKVAFIHGSVARGTENRESDVDIIVVGDVKFSEVAVALSPAQEKLARAVNPSVYPPAEFCSRLRAEAHFLKSVMREPKVFLIGSDDELARLAEKRLAD